MKRFNFIPVIALLALALAGCTLNEKKDATPTSVPQPTPAASTAVPTTATAAAGLDPSSSQAITDGICTALIPDGWVATGNGRGTAPSGARFTLFGNTLSGDADWNSAANIIATVAAGRDAIPTQTADSIAFANQAGTSFEVRRLIGDRYCDFSVTSFSKVPDEERALWPAIGASMSAAPASAP